MTTTRSTTTWATRSPGRRAARRWTSLAPSGTSWRPLATRSTMASAHRAPGGPFAFDRLAQRARRTTVGQVGSYLGAAALVGVGVDHIWQFYVDSYSVIPTIGTLFALNFASALVIELGLVAPLQRLSRRWNRALLTLLAAGGAGIALGSFAGLEVSETTGLFGFMESGYRAAIVLSIPLDAAAGVFLSVFLVAGRRSQRANLPARRPRQ